VSGGRELVRVRSAVQIRADMAMHRRRIGLSVLALREKARLALSWREWFRRAPLTFLGAAFVVGYLTARERRR